MKLEAVIVGLAPEGLALILGSAEAGSSAVVRPMPTDPVEFRKCARDLMALSAAKEHTIERARRWSRSWRQKAWRRSRSCHHAVTLHCHSIFLTVECLLFF